MEAACDECACGAFSVGACDVYGGDTGFGIAEALEEGANGIEAWFDAMGLACIEAKEARLQGRSIHLEGDQERVVRPNR